MLSIKRLSQIVEGFGEFSSVRGLDDSSWHPSLSDKIYRCGPLVKNMTACFEVSAANE